MEWVWRAAASFVVASIVQGVMSWLYGKLPVARQEQAAALRARVGPILLAVLALASIALGAAFALSSDHLGAATPTDGYGAGAFFALCGLVLLGIAVANSLTVQRGADKQMAKAKART